MEKVDVDVNFLASMGFVVKNDGAGQSITMEIRPRLEVSSDFPSNPNYQTGWGDIDFGAAAALRYLAYGDSTDTTQYQFPSPKSVSPAVLDAGRPNEDGTGIENSQIWGVINFMEWVNENPVHVTAMNIRASKAATIPQQVIILTPDIATGQMSRQVIDIASRKTAYQYQNDIITIGDLDLYICRNSVIRFTGTFREQITASDGITSPVPMFIDIFIDRYVSLEKGLTENVKLLNTAAGQANAVTAEINKASAKANPTTLTLNTETQWNEPVYVTPSIPTFGNVQSKSRR